MLHVKSLDESLKLFKALGSHVRLDIIRMLMTSKDLNMNELASRLHITNAALTLHVRKLEECGLIAISESHGSQKQYFVQPDKILVDMDIRGNIHNVFQTEIKVGHFTDFHVYSTCGLASDKALIGKIDDPRYFAHPDRFQADILWFTKGYVEYAIPNLIPLGQNIDRITVTLELGSEAPGSSDVWPSDISFFINDVKIASWTSPGDFSDIRGLFTPDWWYDNWNQYGFLKTLTINRRGTYIDGLPVSDKTVHDFNLTDQSSIRLRIEVEEDAANVGGVTIFGSSFGNYSQDIRADIYHSPML